MSSSYEGFMDSLIIRWQDSCVEIREAAQALLIRELSRLGSSGRRRLIESWTPFLPPLLDPALSIFGRFFLLKYMGWSQIEPDQRRATAQCLQSLSPVTMLLRNPSSYRPSNSSIMSGLKSYCYINSRRSITIFCTSVTAISPTYSSQAEELTTSLSSSSRYLASTSVFLVLALKTRLSEPSTGEDGESGVQQVRRNQATAIILLGVVGAEFGDELNR